MSLDLTPLPSSAFGEQMYAAGVRLVQELGLLPRHVMWDCDEVLWDWVLCGSHIARKGPLGLIRRDLGHREWMQLKPGVFELLYGMFHAARAQGESDPWIRLCTNGYPWRLWCVAHQFPGFAELLGPPADASSNAWASFSGHPRIFSRPDFVEALDVLLDPARRSDWLARFRPETVALLEEHLRSNPFDSNLKLPELATVVGRTAFEDVYVLVDDLGRNIKRFASTGRSGVRVRSRPSRAFRGRVPNMVWRDPWAAIDRSSSDLARGIAYALELVALAPAGISPTVEHGHRIPEGTYPVQRFALDIDDAFIRSEWIGPMDALKARYSSKRGKGNLSSPAAKTAR